MHLKDGMEFTGEFDFPVIEPYRGDYNVRLYPYARRGRLSGKSQGIHFFADDYRFAYATWERLEQTTYRLSRFDTLVCPDRTLFVDASKAQNIESIYKSRFAGAFWQRCGVNVIGTASWSDADSFSYCFDGLPKHSLVAVCGTGITWCRGALELWEAGVRELEAHLSPEAILVYGPEREVEGIHTPLKFITPSHILTTHLK